MMISVKKENSKVKYFLIVASVIFSVYTLFSSMVQDVTHYYFLVPSTYMILLILFNDVFDNFGKFPGITVITIIMFVRYMVLPTIYISTGELSRFLLDERHLNDAVGLIIFEMIAMFIALFFTNKSFNKKVGSYKANSPSLITTKVPKYIPILVIILIVIIMIIKPDMINLKSGIVLGSAIVDEDISSTESFILILWQVLTTWIFIYGVVKQSERYIKSGQKRHVYIAVIYALIFVASRYFSHKRISRWYTLVSTVASIFILLKSFPKDKKKILFLVGGPILLLLLIASLLKNTSLDMSEGSAGYSLFDLLDSSIIDSYFSGISSVANAVGLWHTHTAKLSNMIYDIFNNFPILNHYINTRRSTRYIFNSFIGRSDQIIPLIGQGLIFFSPFFAPLFSVLTIIISRFADVRFLKSKTYAKYIWAFVATWFALIPILNITILFSWLYSRIIPLILFFGVVEFVSKNQGGNR